ncbi:MAG: septal ring lytic transglycosylase RlpA family protein [Rhodospirillales bacterium]|jgi:rare lipoprotein A|nr:septal ring lytic transglycosylase RlpA family protein [Rhodospirillales bacterium]
MNTFLKSGSLKFIVCLCAATLLSACAETQFLVHTAKRVNKEQADDTYGKGIYKIGNPYQIYDVWYYPEVNYDYDETGIASWYGPNFDGKKTANGEIYNMNDLTAAHKTLPLPSWVEVTNLDNGRKIKLRLNDRGPYAKGRIIDISRRGAQLLGFQDQGTAKVRVKILAQESRELAARMRGQATIQEVGSPITVDSLPKASVNAESLDPPPGANVSNQPVTETQVVLTQPEPVAAQETTVQPSSNTVETVPFGNTSIFVQAASFTNYENALRAQAILSQVADTKITQVLVNGVDFYRVRIGPLSEVGQADALLEQAIGSGYPDSHIIVD